MATKKVSLNEFREIVKKIIKEEQGVHKDGQMDMFFNQKETDKFDRKKEMEYKKQNPTNGMIISAWKKVSPYRIMEEVFSDFGIDRDSTVFIDDVKSKSKDGSTLLGYKIEPSSYVKSKTDGFYEAFFEKIKNNFKYPHLLKMLKGNREYAPEQKFMFIGVELPKE
jgi:hypothetical protein